MTLSFIFKINLCCISPSEISRFGQNFKFGALNGDIMTVCIEYNDKILSYGLVSKCYVVYQVLTNF